MASDTFVAHEGVNYYISESDIDSRGEQRIVVTENYDAPEFKDSFGCWHGNRCVWAVNDWKHERYTIYKDFWSHGGPGAAVVVSQGDGVFTVAEFSKMIREGRFG